MGVEDDLTWATTGDVVFWFIMGWVFAGMSVIGGLLIPTRRR